MLPNAYEITFKVKANTTLNQSVRIVGDIESLGLWEPSLGLQLTTDMHEYPYWTNKTPLLISNKETKFKFKVIILEHDHLLRWETLPRDLNRKYKPKFTKVRLEFTESDFIMREIILEKLPTKMDKKASLKLENLVIKKKVKGAMQFDPYSIAACYDDSFDDEDDDSDDSLLIEESNPSFDSDSDQEEKRPSITVIKSSFYHSPAIMVSNFPQKIDHSKKMKELYNQMRSQTHNRLWHLSSKFTLHDPFYDVNEDDLTIFEGQDMMYIVTFNLPIVINILPDNSYEIKPNYVHEWLAIYEYCKKYQKDKFAWIGLHKQIPSKAKKEVGEILSSEHNCHPIYLDPDMYDRFKYECKRYLKGHFQNISFSNKFDVPQDFWTTYELVNYRVAEKILSLYEKGYVLINDYRLLLVPSLCTKQKAQLKLHYILNFNIASSSSFLYIPSYPQIINSILSSSVLSFDSHDDMCNFVEIVQKLYGARMTSRSGYLALQLYGRFIVLNANAQLARDFLLAKKEEAPNTPKTLKIHNEVIINNDVDGEVRQVIFLSIDSVNSKTIEAKFKALEQLLLIKPEVRGKIKLIQIFNYNVGSSDQDQIDILKKYNIQATNINKKFSEYNDSPIQIVINDLQDHKYFELYYQKAQGFIDTNLEKLDNANLQKFIEYKEGKAILIVNEEISDKYADLPFTFGVSPISVNDIATQLRDCFDIIINLNEVMTYNHRSQRLPLIYVEEWLIKSHMAISKCSILMRNAKFFSTYVLSKSSTHDYMLAACSANFRKPILTDIPIKYISAATRVFILPFETLLTNEALQLLENNKASGVNTPLTSKDIDPEISKMVQKLAQFESNMVAMITKRSKAVLDSTLGHIPHIHLLAENGCFYKNTTQNVWVNITEEPFQLKDKVRSLMSKYQKNFETFKLVETESELKLVGQDNYFSSPVHNLLNNLHKEIAQIRYDNNKLEVLRFGNSVHIRPYNINKGTITQILLQKTFQEKGKIGFLFCLGKTSSDEEMFAGIAKSVKMSQEIFTEVKHIFTCAIGYRPSYATYYVNTRDEIKSLFWKFPLET